MSSDNRVSAGDRPAARTIAWCAAAFVVSGCANPVPEPARLPTGVRLDPAGASIELGSMPVAMIAAPGGNRVVVVLSGYREQGLQVVDRRDARVVQTLVQPAAFLGAVFSPDGRHLYASGGSRDRIYVYAWEADTAALVDSIPIGRQGERLGQRYPAGLAVSPDGAQLYVAENLSDSLAVVDLARGRVVQRLPAGLYPYAVVAADSMVYLSQWAGSAVSSYVRRKDALVAAGEIPVARHPSALLLNADGSRLFAASASSDQISVVDTRAAAVIATLRDAAPAGPAEGSTPNGLALSADGHRLFVAEADNNAVAIFDLVTDSLVGRVPVEWYPTAVLAFGDTLLALNGKGLGTAANPAGPGPGRPRSDPRDYTLGQTTGSLTTVTMTGVDLAAMDARVAAANGWVTRPSVGITFPPFTHVIYVIKENRTYDQVLGDLPDGDGDSTLTYFPRAVTPNHHALAERFGTFDRFFVNAEVSADGHNWTTAAWAPDYVEKTVPSNYSGRGRNYDYEGENRGVDVDDEDDVDSPSTGYLWDQALRAGVSLRNFGEFAVRDTAGRWVATKDALAPFTAPEGPGWDLDVPDQARADAWLAEFRGFVAADTMPGLTILRLPNDHTAGASAGAPTPRAYMADNDLALGRIIDALSHSPFWTNTVVFVLEDDAQNGPDHVDSHRSPLLVISAYNRPGVISRFANTTDVLATIGAILDLEPLSQFDYYGRPLIGIFAAEPDTTAFSALTPETPLDETNPKRTALAALSRRLDFTGEDRADDELFNRVLWQAIKGGAPYPGARRIPVLEVQRAR